ncbi:hypothetical protein BC829DRAFT_380801 [Chytridium lagenaria]|nr:hypothetical protein BC829DRAFT_380801 [Chytridium lagenaria]
MDPERHVGYKPEVADGLSDKSSFLLPKKWSFSSKYGTSGTSPETLLEFISDSKASSSEAFVDDGVSDEWLSRAASTCENTSSFGADENIYENITLALNKLLQLANPDAKTLDAVFEMVTLKYGFQEGSRDNAKEYFLSLLDSRACKDTIVTGLRSLHGYNQNCLIIR